jgi:hypothetical protein
MSLYLLSIYKYEGILCLYKPRQQPLLVQDTAKIESFPKTSLIFQFDGWRPQRYVVPIFAFLPSRSELFSIVIIFELPHGRYAVFLQRLIELSSSLLFWLKLLIVLARLLIIWLFVRAIPFLIFVRQFFQHFPSPIFLSLF